MRYVHRFTRSGYAGRKAYKSPKKKDIHQFYFTRGFIQAMVDIAAQSHRKKKRSQHPHGLPRNPNRVLEIDRLRGKGLVWRDIGPRIGTTGMAACLLYHRWKDWIKEQR